MPSNKSAEKRMRNAEKRRDAGRGAKSRITTIRRSLMEAIDAGDKGKSDAIVLHSLPRMDELPMDVDTTRHARYWVEAYNGVLVRMALLALILGAIE